jgi:hypothetical protein
MPIADNIIIIGVQLKDWLTIIAIIIAPIAALWIQSQLDERKEKRNR